MHKQMAKTFSFKQSTNNVLIFGILIGIASFVIGLYFSPARSWLNFLVNNFYFTSLALGGFVFLAIQNLTNASWSRSFTRISESLTAYLIAGFVLSLILGFGIHTLYEWSHSEVVANDPIVQAKASYLNTNFFIARTVLFFVAWIIVGHLLKRTNRILDERFDSLALRKLVKFSIIFLICFAFFYSLFSFDMLMSLEPHWFSTIYGIYTFSGLFVNVIAVITLTAIILQRMGYLTSEINENHFHDLGKLLFGFSTFWAYIWFSQYILIWYANIPEETAYYYLRERGTWDWLFYTNLVVNWLIPFFALMTRESKRSKFVLVRVCVLLIVGRWLDIYLLAAPPVLKHHNVIEPNIGFIEIGMAIGFASFFIFITGRALSKAPLLIQHDPYIEEGHHLEQ